MLPQLPITVITVLSSGMTSKLSQLQKYLPTSTAHPSTHKSTNKNKTAESKLLLFAVSIPKTRLVNVTPPPPLSISFR